MAGSGGGMGSHADAMHFVYQTLVGDGAIVARITSLQENYFGNAQAGVMIRENLGSSAPGAFVYYAGDMVYRSATDQNAVYESAKGGSLPQWLKLVRAGSTFTGYTSQDGVNWTVIASTTISMAQSAYVGLGMGGGNDALVATFDSVSINSTATPAPVISGMSPTTASAGSLVVITGAGFGATQGGSTLLLNDAPVPINSWNDTSIVFTVPTGATTGSVVVSVAPDMNDSNPVVLEVTAQPLPTSWLNQNVGVVQSGNASFSGEIYTLSGSGRASEELRMAWSSYIKPWSEMVQSWRD